MATTAKQARHSHFQRGSGSFACRCCSRQTRDTGDNGQTELCSECYELSGIDNHLSDYGSLGDQETAAREYLTRLAEKVGIEKTESCFPEIVAALHKPDSPEEQPEQPSTGYLVAVSGSVNGQPYDELILVDAPAARFARRYARSQIRECGIDTENLVFNARRA